MSDDWRGTFTALITPFDRDGDLDPPRIKSLAERQIEAGVEGLVPCGTTGESVTMSADEQVRVVELVLEAAETRVPVIAGAGGNATATVVGMAKRMAAAGADAILSVVPYYNKPTQEGLIRHFSTIADAIEKPVILYNVPGRTGANMTPATVARLAEHGNVIAVKEASGDLLQAMEIVQSTPDDFRVLSGEDNLTLPLLSIGADGLISVVSNEAPKQMSDLVRAGLAGRFDDARRIHYTLIDLMNTNFIESNPIPVKAAMAMLGLAEESYRLPLVPLYRGQSRTVEEGPRKSRAALNIAPGHPCAPRRGRAPLRAAGRRTPC